MKTFRLKDLGDVIGGSTPSTKVDEYFGGDIPWITPKDLSGYNKRYICEGERNLTLDGFKSTSVKMLPKDTILFSSRAPIGYVAIAGEEVCTNQGFKSIIANEKIDFMYLYYAMKYNTKKIESIATGTSYKEVSGKVLSNFNMIIHDSLEEQKIIADCLSSLDSKIELNNKTNKNLEQQAQEIFKHWFVDFEFPDENGKPYKSNGGEMVESELGMIPKRWEVTRLGAIVDNIKEATKPGQHLKNRKYIPIDTMPMESVTIQQSKSYKEAKSSLFLFEEFDILIGAMRVYFHRVNLAPFDGVTRSTAFILRSKDKDDISYNLFLLNLKETIDYAVKTSKGTTMPYAVWGNGLAEKNIANPSQQLKQKFNDIVFPSLERMINNSKENILLSQLRDTLLPKLMSGEIRIPLD